MRIFADQRYCPSSATVPNFALKRTTLLGRCLAFTLDGPATAFVSKHMSLSSPLPCIRSMSGLTVTSRSGRWRWYPLRAGRSVEHVFGFAKRPIDPTIKGYLMYALSAHMGCLSKNQTLIAGSIKCAGWLKRQEATCFYGWLSLQQSFSSQGLEQLLGHHR